MKLSISKAALISAALFLPCLHPDVAGKAEAASSCLDVALVFAVDSSASVSRDEFALQQGGIAAAFRDAAVLSAISTAGRVAVSVLFWGSEGLPKQQSDWVIVEGKEAAEDFARTVESMPRQVTGDTGLGAGIMTALEKLNAADLCAARKIVNVSGDGEETRAYRKQRRSLPPSLVRNLADTQNIEINALAIANEEDDLAVYYSENVITGPDAFVMEVRNYGEFAEALRRKLIREIGPQVVSYGLTRETGRQSVSRLPPRSSRPAYLN